METITKKKLCELPLANKDTYHKMKLNTLYFHSMTNGKAMCMIKEDDETFSLKIFTIEEEE